ncbi:hypothetical protein [Brucella intermedia]|uniref:hypothetical protein n=1 Tax=Brucella intermedia TaxID=94625 RepID=UPI00235FEA0A|nr:hypothetical protein [Brucella intermedia]
MNIQVAIKRRLTLNDERSWAVQSQSNQLSLAGNNSAASILQCRLLQSDAIGVVCQDQELFCYPCRLVRSGKMYQSEFRAGSPLAIPGDLFADFDRFRGLASPLRLRQ